MMKFDEMYTSLPYEFFSGGEKIRDHYKIYDEWLARQPGDMMATRREEAEVIFRRVGITFAVYGDKDDTGAGHERLIPFDLIPRIIAAREWDALETGLAQRVTTVITTRRSSRPASCPTTSWWAMRSSARRWSGST